MSRLRFAVVGSGPGGFFTAKSLLRHVPGCAVDMFERLPCPFGLVRYGVAPDHPQIKQVITEFSVLAQSPAFRFLGNVEIGTSVQYQELSKHYSAVVFAYGAASDRCLRIPGEDGMVAARKFVEWYNSMPGAQDFDLSTTKTVALIGNGNVALDVARILSSPIESLRTTEISMKALFALEESAVKDIHIIGRRGVMQAACAVKELRLLSLMEGLGIRVFEEDMKRSLNEESKKEGGIDAEKAENSLIRVKKRLFDLFNSFPRLPDPKARVQIHFHFLKSPVELSENVLKLRKNVLSGNRHHQEAVGTEEYDALPCDLSLRSIGYQCVTIDPHLPFDPSISLIPNINGRVQLPYPTYVSGWCKSGPVGIIDTTMRSAFVILQEGNSGVHPL